MGIGIKELILILLIVLILFGAKKVPELAKGLGSGLREFKKAAKEVEEEEKKEDGVKSENKNEQS
jgi:sec-independent protein translocase protein TatA